MHWHPAWIDIGVGFAIQEQLLFHVEFSSCFASVLLYSYPCEIKNANHKI